MKIPLEDFQDMRHGDEDLEKYRVVLKGEVTDTWRWGIIELLIFQFVEDDDDEHFWGLEYQVQTSNEDHHIEWYPDSDGNIKVDKYVGHKVITIKYVRTPE